MATMIRAGDGAANDQARPAGEMAAARQQLREEGWCVIPDVIDAETTRHALDRLYAAAEAS